MNQGEAILKRHNLRVTQSRLAVFRVFQDNSFALSQPDIEKKLETQCDRVTIYRILESFIDSGIIHRVPDNDGKQKFALCDNCDAHEHTDEHLHFKCNRCGKTECLETISLPKVNLPKGYVIKAWNLLVTGVCNSCLT